ncbi:MAG: site-specific integrase [Desulfobacteraceae bacterium]
MGQYKRKLSNGVRWLFRGQYKNVKYNSMAIYSTKTEAKEAEAEKLKEIEKEIKNPRDKMTLFELCSNRLDYIKASKSNAYYRDNQRTFKRLLKDVGDIQLDAIKRPMIHQFLINESKRLKKAGKGNYEVNAELRYIRALFNYAINDLEVLDINPAKKIGFYPIDKKLKYVPSESDFELVYQEAHPQQQGLIMFVKESGCRISEALRAKGSDIDLHMDLLTLWTRKKKNSDLTPRRIPLPDVLREYKCADDEKLFDEWVKNPRFIEKICKKIKIKVFGWHAYRHRKASILAKNNVPLVEIMAILGHDNIEVTQIYLRVLGFSKY